jgi:hypothetical protein
MAQAEGIKIWHSSGKIRKSKESNTRGDSMMRKEQQASTAGSAKNSSGFIVIRSTFKNIVKAHRSLVIENMKNGFNYKVKANIKELEKIKKSFLTSPNISEREKKIASVIFSLLNLEEKKRPPLRGLVSDGEIIGERVNAVGVTFSGGGSVGEVIIYREIIERVDVSPSKNSPTQPTEV